MREFSLSTRIFFGAGALERLSQVRQKRVLIVSDAFLQKSGVVDRVAAYLRDCEVFRFTDIVPDPPIEVVAAGVKALLQCRAEAIIAVGGGSSIDAAKAIRAVAGQTGALNTDSMECFAIPTTSGTGSEVTEYAVISDAERGLKYPLASVAMRPPVAILDADLTISVPPRVTADTGLDALTHALEAYVAKDASDFTDALAEKAVSLIVRFLPDAYRDGGDVLARERLHNASCMAGLAFNAAGLGINHAIAHAVGGKLHVPHGRANAMLLPLVMAFNAGLDNDRIFAASTAAKKYQHLARILKLPASNARIGAGNLVRAVEELNRKLQIPATLRNMGVDSDAYREQRDAIVAAALADPVLAGNPRPADAKDVLQILDKMAGFA